MIIEMLTSIVTVSNQASYQYGKAYEVSDHFGHSLVKAGKAIQIDREGNPVETAAIAGGKETAMAKSAKPKKAE